MSFEAPGLDGLLGGLAQQALGAPQPSGAPPSNSPPSHSGPPAGALAAAPAAAAASGGSALSEAYSFSCPSGASYSIRSEEHTSELQSLKRTSYAVFCLKKKISTDSQI